MDFTDFIDSVKDDYYVESVEVDTSDKTIEVDIVSKLVKKQNKTAEKLEEKLPVAKAWLAVEKYGQQQYGENFKVHYGTGNLNQEAIDENTWSLAAYCDVDDSKKTCKAEVKLSGDSIKVTSFEVE